MRLVLHQEAEQNALHVESNITNASRRTANAWHFYYALVFVITVLFVSLVVTLSAP